MKDQKTFPIYRTYVDTTRTAAVARPSYSPKTRHFNFKRLFWLTCLTAAFTLAFYGVNHTHSSTKGSGVVSAAQVITPNPGSSSNVASTVKPAGVCGSNSIDKLIVVSISKRHLWACQTSNQVYDSPVVTGDLNVAADITPTGSYQIYDKATNLYLDGSDSRGSWHDYVNYWLPFYHSPAYGTFGFHDATWRPSSEFGNIDPASDQSSHGCVEMLLSSAAWLYNWSAVGTSVQVNS